LARTFIAKGLQMRLNLLIALGHLLVVEGRQLDGLASGKQVRSAPGALQRLGDVLLIVVAVGVAQLRQALRVALAREDGLERMAMPVTPVIALTTWVSLRCICSQALCLCCIGWAA
jgi:hypothetical protein